jgi:hypothetical protein
MCGDPTAKKIEKWSIGPGPVLLETDPLQNGESASPRFANCLRHQAGLADTGLARQQQNPALVTAEHVADGRDLLLATDQDRADSWPKRRRHDPHLRPE